MTFAGPAGGAVGGMGYIAVESGAPSDLVALGAVIAYACLLGAAVLYQNRRKR